VPTFALSTTFEASVTTSLPSPGIGLKTTPVPGGRGSLLEKAPGMAVQQRKQTTLCRAAAEVVPLLTGLPRGSTDRNEGPCCFPLITALCSTCRRLVDLFGTPFVPTPSARAQKAARSRDRNASGACPAQLGLAKLVFRSALTGEAAPCATPPPASLRRSEFRKRRCDIIDLP
jgi:hypothetical protein